MGNFQQRVPGDVHVKPVHTTLLCDGHGLLLGSA